MKLHAFAPAPNAAKVRLYLAEKALAGCAVEIEEVVVNLLESEQRSEAFLAKNPMGKVPVLELDDGRFITESLPIIEYLEELHPLPSLWGDDPAERAYARQIERIADQGGLIAIAQEVHATNSPIGLPQNPALAESARERRAIGLGYLENALADGRPFLAGDRVTVADCTLQGGLAFGRFRGIDALTDHPRLRAWHEAFSERKSTEGVILF